MDPATLAIMAAASAGKAIAGIAERNTASKNQVGQINYQMAQDAQDAAAAAARNRVLGDYLGRQDQWIAQNQGDLNTGIAGFMPDAQALRRTGAEGARTASIDTAMGAPATGAVPLRASTPGFVAREFDKKVNEARDLARASGMKLARVGSYGDQWQQNNRDIGATGHKIDTTNTIARGNMSLLPYAQDLEEFQVRAPIAAPTPQSTPWWASLLSGAADLASTYAGSQMGGAKAPATGTTSLFDPTFNGFSAPGTSSYLARA